MTTSKLIPLVLAVAALIPAAANAAIPPQSDVAMRKGIRDYAKYGLDGKTAKTAKIKVNCIDAVKVGSTRPCSGTFSLTANGRTARYTLASNARTFRISPGAMEYHLNAKATKKVAGLPSSIRWIGILQ